MDTQQAYELMRVYLTRPGARRAAVSTCFYEMEIAGETHRCAVGCLFSPAAITELRDYGMISTSVSCLLDDAESSLLAKKELAGIEPEFLVDAQFLHDRQEHWGQNGFAVEMLDELAESYGLTVVADEQVEERAPREAVLVG